MEGYYKFILRTVNRTSLLQVDTYDHERWQTSPPQYWSFTLPVCVPLFRHDLPWIPRNPRVPFPINGSIPVVLSEESLLRIFYSSFYSSNLFQKILFFCDTRFQIVTLFLPHSNSPNIVNRKRLIVQWDYELLHFLFLVNEPSVKTTSRWTLLESKPYPSRRLNSVWID